MSNWRSLYYLGKNTHDHGNFRATHRTPPFHNRHTHSTCFTETRMYARHQCETTTWRHKKTSQKSSDAVASAAVVESDVVEVVATGTGSCWSSDGFTFLLSQVFRRVNWRFCDFYSAVIIRKGYSAHGPRCSIVLFDLVPSCPVSRFQRPRISLLCGSGIVIDVTK